MPLSRRVETMITGCVRVCWIATLLRIRSVVYLVLSARVSVWPGRRCVPETDAVYPRPSLFFFLFFKLVVGAVHKYRLVVAQLPYKIITLTFIRDRYDNLIVVMH